jgi:O-antigen/teichoic acid export membrane protein
MTAKEKQIKNSFIYLLPMVVTSLLPFLILPIFTRILTIENYGVLALAQIYATFTTGLANFGLLSGFERNFFQYSAQEKRAQLFYSVLIFVIFALISLGTFTFFMKEKLAHWIIGSSEHGNFLFLAYCANSTSILIPLFQSYYRNTENAKRYAGYAVLRSVLANTIAFVLIVFFKIGVSGILWGQLISGICVLSVMIYSFLLLMPFTTNWQLLKECLKISYPLTPRILLKIINTQFDKYMIGLMGSVGAVGVYNIGERFSNLAFVYMTTLQQVFAPQVYKRMFEMNDQGGKSIGQYLTPFVYLSIAAAVSVALFSEEIIIILTPKSYHGAIDIVIILSMYFGILFFGKQPQLIYVKKTHIVTVLFLLSMTLNIGLNIPFIMKWGIKGAAWATFIAGLISTTITFCISQHYYKIEWEYKKLIAIYGILFTSSITIILLREFSVEYAIRILVKLLFVACYVVVGVKINILTKENILLIAKLFSLKVRPT